MTGTDLVTAVLRELRVVGAADPPSADDTDYVLGKMNRLIDAWNAQRSAVYADIISTFTLVPGTQPHTIGPAASSPTWTATQRPVSIVAANLVLSGGSRIPIELVSDGAWMGQSDPTTTGDPSVLRYVPQWPLGECWFWPVPSSASSLELLSRVLLSAFDLTTDITLAPGYESAIVLTVAENCARVFTGQDAAGSLILEAREARARIFANNDRIPRLATADDGLAGSNGRSRFDYLTGRAVGGWVDPGL